MSIIESPNGKKFKNFSEKLRNISHHLISFMATLVGFLANFYCFCNKIKFEIFTWKSPLSNDKMIKSSMKIMCMTSEAIVTSTDKLKFTCFFIKIAFTILNFFSIHYSLDKYRFTFISQLVNYFNSIFSYFAFNSLFMAFFQTEISLSIFFFIFFIWFGPFSI